MMASLKWIVSGLAGVIFVGALITVNRINSQPEFTQPDAPAVAQNTQQSAYPVPEVSVLAQAERPSQDEEMLDRSSDLYGDSASYNRHRRWTKKKSHHKQTAKDAWPKDADPEMGFIAAADKKLIQAEAKTAATPNGFTEDPGPVGH